MIFDAEEVAAAIPIVLAAIVIALGLTLAFGFVVYQIVVQSSIFWR